MILDSSFIVLDLLWDDVKNNGSMLEVDPILDGDNEYWWRCLGCGNSFKDTFKEVHLKAKRLKTKGLDIVCTACEWSGTYIKSYLVKDLEKLSEGYKNKVKSLIKPLIGTEGNSIYCVATCPDCKEVYIATTSTLMRRGSICCKECSSMRKAVEVHGSIATVLPDVVPYYSDENVLTADKFPVWRTNVNGNNVTLICPRCKGKHVKRLDAVIKNGAYCGPCAKSKNSSKKGNSLYENYPDVAEMFDKGDNGISSKEISQRSSNKYYFMCEKGGKPHIFSKSVVEMVKARDSKYRGCPVCSGYEVRKGINDFKSRCPEMAKYWDYDSNIVSPDEVYYKSQEEYAFICSEGHEFMRDPSHMLRSIGTKSLGCSVCHGREIVKGINDLVALRPDVLEYWSYDFNDITPEDVTIGSNKMVWFNCMKKGCNNVYQTTVFNRVNGRVCTCEDCRKRSWSIAEKELASIIKSWGIKVIEEYSCFGGKYNLDIYIPDKKVAIEYNGLYWHSDEVRSDPHYHYNKYITCKKADIELIYVWEDDYTFKREIVLKMLKRNLGISNDRKVSARDCKIGYESYGIAKSFLEENHIQGSISGEVYISLRENTTNELVAVAVFQDNNDGSALLKRYSTNCMLRGGFSKIVKFMEDNYIITGITTFSDNGVSDGRLYANTGFKIVDYLKPDYSYVQDGRRKHKFNFRLERFKKDENLRYEDGLSEKDLAILNKLFRVWDAGKIKWFKEKK